MRRLLIMAMLIGLITLCLIPWVAMEPNFWRVPAAIGLAPFALPGILFVWFGEWGHAKKLMRTFTPAFVARAWDNS